MTARCTVCGSVSTAKMFSSCNRHGRHVVDNSERFDFYRCYSCRAVFPSLGKIDEAFYSRYYTKDYYKSSGAEGFLVKKLVSYSVRKKSEFILKMINPDAKLVSLLDVGCGACAFIRRLDKRLFRPVGADISSESEQACRDSGIEFIKGDIMTADVGDRKFDVITLWHVLEHIQDPVALLKRLAGMLAKGGIIVLALPDTGSIGFKVGADLWFHTDAPRHLFLPCTETMNYIAGNARLRIRSSCDDYIDYPLDLMWSVRNSWKRLYIYPFYPIFKRFSGEIKIYACENIE